MKSILIPILSIFLLIGCQKEIPETFKSSETTTTDQGQQNNKSNDCLSNQLCDSFDCLFNKVTSFEESKESDALVFHITNAFQSVMSNASNRTQVFGSQGLNGLWLSMKEVITSSSVLKSQFNIELKNSINNYNLYPKNASDLLGQNYNSQNFDLAIEVFEFLETRYPKNEVSIYSLEEKVNSSSYSAINLGADISLPCDSSALIFENGSIIFQDEIQANSSSNPILFIGMSATPELDFRFDNCDTKKLDKWFHHGKITWLPCTLSAGCDIKFTWETKRRWHSFWKFQSSGTLIGEGQFNEISHSEYRIQCKACWVTAEIDNYALFQKHWLSNPWTQIH